MLIEKKVIIEPVFRIDQRTGWEKWYVRGYGQGVSSWGRARLVRWISRKVFSIGRKVARNSFGQASVRTGPEWRTFRYRIMNTQFHSLYEPIYAMGYEPETSALITTLLKNSRCFFDIGSNWGFFSVFAAANGFKGEIRAFELQPEVYADLRQVVLELGLDSAIQCENIGLSDQRGRSGVHIADGLHSGIGQMAAGDTVEVRTLDDYITSKPDLLKIDVEGAEARVLRGGERVLSECRPWIIFESWCNRSDIQAGLESLDELAKQNYQFYQPVLIKDGTPHAPYHTYGQYWDIEERMILRLVPFTIEQRQLMQRHFNVLACPNERLNELAEIFEM